MRLTKKRDNLYYIPVKKGMLVAGYIDKLGLLEDIEKELGIDLITLFKALKYPIYVKEKDQTWWCSNRLFFALHEAFIVITYWKGKKKEDITLLLRDYGKTWALTKEELE